MNDHLDETLKKSEKLDKLTILNGEVKDSDGADARTTLTNEIRFKMLLDENQSLTRQNHQLQTLLNESEKFCQDRESKLKTILKSVEMFKEDMSGREEDGKNYQDLHSSTEIVALKAKVKNLEKQNKGLQLCFRKHMQLIDVLKRQKVHLEASRVLNHEENNNLVLEEP